MDRRIRAYHVAVDTTTTEFMIGADPRQETLVLSLQKRYAAADSRDDAQAKQALFKEAVYLNILPELLDPERPETSPINVSDG